MESQKTITQVAKAITTIIKAGIREDWRFPGGSYGISTIANGLERMKKLYPYEGMSESRIIDFVVYQIYRCRDKIADGNWTLSWAFSDNAVERYRRQFMDVNGKSGMNYYINIWLKQHGMSREGLTRILLPQENSMKKYVNPVHEEEIKGRFFNKDVGFFLCQSSSTGWNPKSDYCRKCKFMDKCMDATEKKYPEITRLRKEQQIR